MNSQKKYPPKIADILARNGYFNDSVNVRRRKHEEFLRNAPKVLDQEEKHLLLGILDDKTHRGGGN
jgi:hypothetical protein